MCRCVGRVVSKTVSLEKSAYERLKASKLPGESFTDVVNRLVKGSAPSFRVLAGSIEPADSRAIKRTIHRMRAAEAAAEQASLKLLGSSRGSHSG